MKNIFLILGLILFSCSIFAAAKYEGGFCRTQRSASSDNKNNANLSWLKLECFNSKGQPVKGQTALPEMHIPARWDPTGNNQISRGYPSHLVIDGKKVSNDGIDGLDYFDLISGYGKTVENCKKKFPGLSCKNIGFTLQPGAKIYNRGNQFQESEKVQKCTISNSGMTGRCAETASDQFEGQDFVEACATVGCGRRGLVASPPVIPTPTDIAAEKEIQKEIVTKKPIDKINDENKNCVPDQAKYNALKSKMQMCLSGFHMNKSNAQSMYETAAMYLSCSEFDFSSALVVQEGKHQAAVARNPAQATETNCPVRLEADVDADVGYGKIEFKDKSGKITSVDWDSKFDTTYSANNQPYWRADFGRKLMATLNSNSSSGSSGSRTQPQPANSNK